MTNQKYIEEIIKVAIEGDWDNTKYGFTAGIFYGITDGNGLKYHKDIFLDPNFFKALLGKEKVNWGGGKTEKEYQEIIDSLSDKSNLQNIMKWGADGTQERWIWYWHTFLDKIIEKDLDHAIEWLYNLIKE